MSRAIPNRRRRSDGQILVIFAGGLLLLLAIAALVIDLGFVFMIRRHEQNAADPGAIAAARYLRTGTGGVPEPARMREAACFYARQNGFFPAAADNTECVPAKDPNGSVLTVNFPPGANTGTWAGNTDAVEVIVSRPHQTFFARALGLTSINVRTSAVATFSDGNSNTSSLIALDPIACPAGKTHGTGDITITPVAPGIDGGYVHINSTCGTTTSPDGLCTNGTGALKIDGSGNLTAPETYVAGGCQGSIDDLPGGLTEGAVAIGDPLGEVPPPDINDYLPGRCGPGQPLLTPASTGCKFTSAGVINLEPGIFYGGWEIRNNVTLVLAPGVYVMAGGGIGLNAGGSITSVQGGTGDPAPVLFFNTDNPSTGTGQAGIDFTATSTLKLRAIDTGPFRGILVWNDAKGSNPRVEISLGGQTSLDISGTIYNPLGSVKVEGGSGTGGSAAIQVIANTFDVGGNSNLAMPYDPGKLYQFPGKGLVR